MTIGEKIKQRRIELDMSQDELAKKCGYKSRSSIQKIESSRDLPLKKVKAMASALDLSYSYLMGWEDFEYDEESHTWEFVDKKSDTDIDFLQYINDSYSPERLKTLFEITRDLSDEEFERVINIIKAFTGKE